MADDFSSAQTADLAASGERQITGQPVKKTTGVKIACPGGVDDAHNRRRRDAVLGPRRQDHAALRAARQGGNRDMPAHPGGGRGEVVRLIERADLGVIGKEYVDMSVDEVA